MYWKIMFDRCYCINSTIYLLQFGKLCGTIFCHRLAVTIFGHHFWISVFLVRVHQEIQDGCHHSIPPRYFENDSTRWLLYNCSSAKWETNPSTKTEKGLPLYAIISMMDEPNPLLCHPAVLGSRNFAICFVLKLFYSQFQFDIVKI